MLLAIYGLRRFALPDFAGGASVEPVFVLTFGSFSLKLTLNVCDRVLC